MCELNSHKDRDGKEGKYYMTNSVMLWSVIRDSGISVSFLAAKMEISRETLYSKVNCESEFKASEIVKLSTLLHLTRNQVDAIFFA